MSARYVEIRLSHTDACIMKIRELLSALPYEPPGWERDENAAPASDPTALYDLVPDDHRQPYDMRQILGCVLDGGPWDEFQADRAPEMRALAS